MAALEGPLRRRPWPSRTPWLGRRASAAGWPQCVGADRLRTAAAESARGSAEAPAGLRVSALQPWLCGWRRRRGRRRDREGCSSRGHPGPRTLLRTRARKPRTRRRWRRSGERSGGGRGGRHAGPCSLRLSASQQCDAAPAAPRSSGRWRGSGGRWGGKRPAEPPNPHSPISPPHPPTRATPALVLEAAPAPPPPQAAVEEPAAAGTLGRAPLSPPGLWRNLRGQLAAASTIP